MIDKDTQEILNSIKSTLPNAITSFDNSVEAARSIIETRDELLVWIQRHAGKDAQVKEILKMQREISAKFEPALFEEFQKLGQLLHFFDDFFNKVKFE
jgi:hypothetical protein